MGSAASAQSGSLCRWSQNGVSREHCPVPHTFHNPTDGAIEQEGLQRPQEALTLQGRGGGARIGGLCRAWDQKIHSHKAPTRVEKTGQGWCRPGPWGPHFSRCSCSWPQVSDWLLIPSCQARRPHARGEEG